MLHKQHLSVDDTKDIITELKKNFPEIKEPKKRRYLLCNNK